MKRWKKYSLLLLLPALFSFWQLAELGRYPIASVADYSTLYFVTDKLAIRTGHLEGSALAIDVFGSTDSSWTLLVDGQSTREVGAYLPLSSGVHDYILSNRSGESVELTLDFSPPTVNVVKSSVPVDQEIAYSLADWTGRYNEGEAEEHLKRAQEMLRVLGNIPAREKIRRILVMIKESSQSSIGRPSKEMERLSGLAAFFLLKERGEKVWCSNLARMYCALANVAGIPTREVHAVGYRGNISYTGHAFTESYIEEEGRWILVDPSFPSGWIEDGYHQTLNAAQHLQQQKMEGIEDRYFNAKTHLFYLFPRPGPRPLSFAWRLYYFLFQKKLAYSLNPHSLHSFGWGDATLIVLIGFIVLGVALIRQRTSK